jgi:deazaflavin-dependent oxidoreductase (nitroreductase family)
VIARLARWLGQTRPMVWLARTVIVPADSWVARRTGGRLVTFGLRELPTFLLTTIGRRSGQPRTVPLLYLPLGDQFVVVGSNFGGESHPAWSANLLAHPKAEVNVRGRPIPVTARLVEDDEREELMKRLRELWPAYDKYAQWSQRTLRVFLLTPDG